MLPLQLPLYTRWLHLLLSAGNWNPTMHRGKAFWDSPELEAPMVWLSGQGHGHSELVLHKRSEVYFVAAWNFLGVGSVIHHHDITLKQL